MPGPSDARLTLFSIGHSSRDFDEFAALLQTHGVTQVADVRRLPGSRRHPQFGRDTLPAALAQINIAYLHFPELGGLRRPRPDSPNTGWQNRSFQGYADYMATPEFEQGIDQLLERAASRLTAIMCAEAVPWRCHRSLIADALVARGVRVEHILGRSRREPHSLRPWACLEGSRIIYPPPDDPPAA
jgi:uncharacterized protein (DUF488 family)